MNETRERKDFETIRKNPQELQRLIRVFNQMGTNVKDSRYQDIAGYHGAPKRYCHKLETAFLAWHRMYILEFENRMREIDSTITLPYIDWGNDKYNIPDEFTNEPILKSAMIFVNSGGFNTSRKTRRSDTRDPLELQRALDDIFQGRLEIDTMIDFSNLLNGPHGSFHVWVGGDMGDPTYAGFDPIFWMHHSNVDRLWTVWQKSESGSKIQQNDINNKEKYLELDFSSRGFQGIKYKDLLNNSKLPGGAHVTYQNETSPFITHTNVRTLARSMLIETVKPKIHVSVIKIQNLGHTIGSYTISVNAKINGNKVYVGSISLFGFGKCCTKTTCKKIYDDAGETFHRFVPSFEIEAALIESIELQFDFIPTNTNKKKQRITIDAFEEELLCDDKKPISVSLHQIGENKDIEFHHEKNSNIFNKK